MVTTLPQNHHLIISFYSIEENFVVFSLNNFFLQDGKRLSHENNRKRRLNRIDVKDFRFGFLLYI